MEFERDRFRHDDECLRPISADLTDRDCSSVSPAVLYGYGTGGDGAPYRSVGDFGTMIPLELELGYAVAPAARLGVRWQRE